MKTGWLHDCLIGYVMPTLMAFRHPPAGTGTILCSSRSIITTNFTDCRNCYKYSLWCICDGFLTWIKISVLLSYLKKLLIFGIFGRLMDFSISVCIRPTSIMATIVIRMITARYATCLSAVVFFITGIPVYKA